MRALLLALLLTVAVAAPPAAAPKEDPFRPLSFGEEYAKKDTNVIKVFLEAKNTTRVAVHQWHSELDGDEQVNGLPTIPGNRIIFEVPPAFHKTRTLDKLILLHRKDSEDKRAMKSVAEIPDGSGKKDSFYYWDYQPCLHQVKARAIATGKWHKWIGPHGPSKFGSPNEYRDPPNDPRRFAEPRAKGDPDYDMLPDASKYMGEEAYDLIMVENVSNKLHSAARCRVHGLIAQYRPFRAKLDRNLDTVHIFTNGTRFADPDYDIYAPHFGGGQDQSISEVENFKAIYPGAPKIMAGENLNEHLNPWLSLVNGGLVIRIRAAHLWAGCEIAMGDRKLDPKLAVKDQVDMDGQIGKPGKAIAFAYLRNRANGRKSYLASKYPVGAAQVLSVGPAIWHDINTPPPDGGVQNPFFSSFVRLDTSKDWAYIMGVRCRYFKDDSIFFAPGDYGPAGNTTNTKAATAKKLSSVIKKAADALNATASAGAAAAKSS